MTTLLNFLISLVLALLCTAVPWGVGRIKTWQILVVFCVSLALWIVGAALSLGWYPWTDVVDFLVCVGAGILLARVISAKFWPFFIFLLILSILDIVQILLTFHGGNTVPVTRRTSIPAGDFYSNFLLLLPWVKYGIGPFDLLVMAAIGAHWHKRNGPFLLAFGAMVISLVITYVIFIANSNIVLPLIPFLTLGWLGSAAIGRVLKQPGAGGTPLPARNEASV